MFTQRTFLSLVLCAALASPSAAQSVEDAQCCISGADFGRDLRGICVTAVPETGVLRLGSRIIRRGDVLTAGQLEGRTFCAGEETQEDAARIRYLPMSDSGLQEEAELVISIRGRKNEAPTAEDSKMETYKNLPNEGLLTVTDPEGDPMTFTVTRLPRRGDVILREDGSFKLIRRAEKPRDYFATFDCTEFTFGE